MSIIYLRNDENNMPSQLSPEWFRSNLCTWVHCFHDFIYILYITYYIDYTVNCALIFFSILYVIHIIYTTISTRNISAQTNSITNTVGCHVLEKNASDQKIKMA